MSSSNAAHLLAAAVLVVGAPAFGVEDLATLEVQGQRGQSADQARRDRYECHHWAVEQSGETPLAASVSEEQASTAKNSQREERIDRALAGAAIGAGVGGVASAMQHADPGPGLLAGAAVGAVIGAVTAGRSRDSADAAQPEEPSDYLRALTACLEGRGYRVALPSSVAVAANR
jgi:hypothetical protein